MSRSAHLGTLLTVPAQGFPRLWAPQRGSAGGWFRDTAQTAAPNGAEVRGTSAEQSPLLPASFPLLLHEAAWPPPAQLRAPQKPSALVFPCTSLVPRGYTLHRQDCLLETPPKPTSPASFIPRLSTRTHVHSWDWEPAGALDSGIRYGDCVQPRAPVREVWRGAVSV